MTGIGRRALIKAAGLASVSALAGCLGAGHSSSTAPTISRAHGMTPADQTPRERTLVVYFSRPGENYWRGGRRDLRVGNTKKLARIIADRIACDEYEILAADPYPEAYDPTVGRNVREQNDDARSR